jgi:hypothetical protein
MVRKTVVVAGLFLAALAFVLDSTASNAEACGGCRRGCGYGGGCGYTVSYYRGGGCGGCYARCAPVCPTPCTTCATCCPAPCTTCYAPVYVAPACCAYAVPATVYTPVYVNNGSRPQYMATTPILPVSTYGMRVVMPSGTVAARSVLVGYSR